MFSSVISGTVHGMDRYLISVEVDFSQGLPCFVMVGSLSPEVRESAERVRIALKNMKITIPPMHICVNLSPADIKKNGTRFDFPIALGLLTAMERISPSSLKNTLVLGEVGLNGEIKRVDGVMPIVWEAAKNGIGRCLVPKDNAREVSLVDDMEVIGIESIDEALRYLNSDSQSMESIVLPTRNSFVINQNTSEIGDFAEISGQESLKRGALIAAAGGHHLLLMGPPGSGKTMIASRLPSIMPPLTREERMDITAIYSIAGKLTKERPVINQRPFVAPHHTVSPQGITGGGSIPRPGAVSLAHKGILFLDELPEFRRETIDLLRQPLEEGSINISRAAGSFTYPARVMLVAAMNPCPCGYYPDIQRCSCPPAAIKRYLSHISGPILDRIDICLTASRVKIKDLQEKSSGMSSAEMKEIVIRCRELQKERYSGEAYSLNSGLDVNGIKRYCHLGDTENQMLERMCNSLEVSARGYHRILRVARTIADLDLSEEIKSEHLTEALCYRPQLPKC